MAANYARTKKEIFVKLNMLIAITLLAVAGIAVPARALQAIDVVTVPFEFVVGSTTLPAGTYTLSTTQDTNSPLLLSNREHSVFLLPVAFDSTQAGDARFGFDKIGGEHVLSQISTPTGTYTIDDRRETQRLTKLAQSKDNSPATGMTSSGGQ